MGLPHEVLYAQDIVFFLKFTVFVTLYLNVVAPFLTISLYKAFLCYSYVFVVFFLMSK